MGNAVRPLLLLIAFMVISSGCSKAPPSAKPRIPTKAEYDRITEGMTTADVEAILGEPQNRVEKGDMPEEVKAAWKEDIWFWGGRRQVGKEIRVYFKDGKVTRKDSHGL